MHQHSRKYGWLVAAVCIVVCFVFLKGLYYRGDHLRMQVTHVDLREGRMQIDVPSGFKLDKGKQGKEILRWGGRGGA